MKRLAYLITPLAFVACSKAESKTELATETTETPTAEPTKVVEPAVAPAVAPTAPAPAPTTLPEPVTFATEDETVQWDVDGQRFQATLSRADAGSLVRIAAPGSTFDLSFTGADLISLEVIDGGIVYIGKPNEEPDTYTAVRITWDAAAKKPVVAKKWECDPYKTKTCKLPAWTESSLPPPKTVATGKDRVQWDVAGRRFDVGVVTTEKKDANNETIVSAVLRFEHLGAAHDLEIETNEDYTLRIVDGGVLLRSRTLVARVNEVGAMFANHAMFVTWDEKTGPVATKQWSCDDTTARGGLCLAPAWTERE